MKKVTLTLASSLLLLTGQSAAGAQGPASSLDCLVEPHVVIDVSSPVPGVIGSINVEKSDLVERGQPLAQLESAVWESTVREARSKAQASAAVGSAKVNVAFAERNLQRITDLFEKGVVASHHLDEARTEVDLAKLDLQRARENRQLARLELARAEESLRQRTISSPIDGVVVSRTKSPGEFVEVSPILAVAQLNPLKIQVIAPASLFGTISEGMQAQVKVESSAEPYLADVSLVDRIVDGASGSFGVQLELPNPEYLIPVGLRCKVTFPPGGMQAQRRSPSRADAATADGVEKSTAVPSVAQSAAAQSAAKPKSIQKSSSASPGDSPDRLAHNPVAESTSCLTVGPITDPAVVAVVENRLAEQALPYRRRDTPSSRNDGFLVVSAAQSDLAAANALRNRIHQSGVVDVVTLRRAPYANRVSVGVYDKRDLAAGRSSAVNALGFDTLVIARKKFGNDVWLEVSADGANAAPDQFSHLLTDTALTWSSATEQCLADGEKHDRRPDGELHADFRGPDGD